MKHGLPGRAAQAEAWRFGRTAGLLSVGVGAAGLLTYLFFSIASHVLDSVAYGEIVVLWSAVFVAISILFRPVEQLLSRTIAERRAHGLGIGQPLRVAATIQLGLTVAFTAAALALRGPLEDLLSGESDLYWILVGAVVGYAAGFYARGFLAGSRRFALYGCLLLAESAARVSFALAVAVGIASGQTAVALGILVAPILSLAIVPLAFARRPAPEALDPALASPAPDASEFTLAAGGGFAGAVLLIMISEQALLSAGPLLVRAFEGAAAAGFIFNVLMLARAPLVLFQAVATSLLPHLTRLRSSAAPGDAAAFHLSVRMTVVAIVAFTAVVVLVVLAAGPELMQIAFGDEFDYDRLGLLIVALGMGLYLCSGTLNQAALAHGQVQPAAASWIACAVVFVAWNFVPGIDVFRRVEIGFTAAAGLLCLLLYVLYRHPAPRGEWAPIESGTGRTRIGDAPPRTRPLES
jgi:O-antigen/teichoic acid export membrane protein